MTSPRVSRIIALYTRFSFPIFAVLLFLLIAQLPRFPIDRAITPDSTLYLGLARNLLTGVGFVDTIRNDEILPSIGHPLLLATADRLRMSPWTSSSVLLTLSACLGALAVRSGTRSTLLGLSFVALYSRLANTFTWYGAGAEASIVFTSSLTVLALVWAFRPGPRLLQSTFVGLAWSLAILVRPLFLYPLLASWTVLAVVVCWRHLKSRVHSEQVLLTIFLGIGLAGAILGATWVRSQARYGDERLLTGTYGAIPLYCGNNRFLPVDAYYSSGMWARVPEPQRTEALAPLQNTDGWKNRERRLLHLVREYVADQRERAFLGWQWRFSQYMGRPFDPDSRYSVFVRAFNMLFLARVVAALFRRHRGWGTLASAGVLVSLLFYLQVAVQSVFAFTEARFLTHAMVFLTAGTFLMLGEILELSRIWRLTTVDAEVTRDVVD